MIGDPVSYSISELVYPFLYKKYSINGLFEKIKIAKSDLKPFFQNKNDFNFITVTMPHKIAVLEYCDILSKDAESIGSVNFISQENGRFSGYNFDGIGALDVIEKRMSIFNKKVVIVGAGGAARAAIFEAKKRGGVVVCVNRTHSKGQQIAKFFDVEFSKNIPKNFDVLINATNIGMDPKDDRSVIINKKTLQEKIVLDMASREGLCRLKEDTVSANGVYITGKEMFLSLTMHGLKNVCKLNS